jgi:hypothetical protein
MKSLLFNAAALLSGFTIVYFLYHGVAGALMLLSILFYMIGWVILAFCIVCVVTLPITILYVIIRAIVRDMLK